MSSSLRPGSSCAASRSCFVMNGRRRRPATVRMASGRTLAAAKTRRRRRVGGEERSVAPCGRGPRGGKGPTPPPAVKSPLEQTAYSLRHPGQRSNHRPRTVLVLGGGGMRGLAHVGVLRAMRTLGIEYDAIVGTSIGALVGAMAAGGLSVETIEALVAKVQKEDYFRLNFLKFLFNGTRIQSINHGETFRASLAKT